MNEINPVTTINATTGEIEILIRGAKKMYRELKMAYANEISAEREDVLMYRIANAKHMIQVMEDALESIRVQQKMAADINAAVCEAVAEELQAEPDDYYDVE